MYPIHFEAKSPSARPISLALKTSLEDEKLRKKPDARSDFLSMFF